MISAEHQPSPTFDSVPKLSDIAATKVALSLVHRKIVVEYPWNKNANNELYAVLRLRSMSIIPLAIHNWDYINELMSFPMWRKAPGIFLLANELRLDESTCMANICLWAQNEIPLVVSKMINQAGIRIGFELWSWLYTHCNVFNDRKTLEIIVIDLFDEFVWNPEGTLNNEKTAKNLVSNTKLSDLDKFSMSCEYCMVDEIKRLWPVVENDSKVQNVVFEKQPIKYYWIYNLKGDLQEMPVLEGQIAEETMIEIKPFHNRLSIEYFWNFINPDDQLLKIVKLIFNTCDCFETVLYLIQKLSDKQFNELVITFGDELLMIAIEKIPYPKYIFELWIRMKDLISEDQFYSVFLFILDLEHECEVSGIYPFRSEVLEKFQQMWFTAPNQLKQHTLEQWTSDGGNFFRNYRDFSLKKLLRPIHFLKFVLHDATNEQRSQIWRDNWQYFITGTNPRSLNELMELCLEKDDIVKFKELEMTNYANIENYCTSLMGKACFAEMEAFLNFCTSFHNEKKEFLKNQIEQSSQKYVFGTSYSIMLDQLD